MYATQVDFLHVCYYYFRRRSVHLVQSFECNLDCPFCSTNLFLRKRYNIETTNTISTEYVDKAIEYLRGDGLLVISGGEPMLHPDICQYICDQCRKNKIISVLYSNGFWGTDEATIEKVKKEIKPDYLGLSIDKVHNSKIPLKTIYNIVDNFMGDDVSTRVYFNHLPEIGLKEKLPDKYKKLFCQPIQLFQTVPDSTICTRLGYELLPNGMVEAFCEKKMHHPCYCGKLEDMSLKKIIKKHKQPIQCVFHKEKKTFKTVLNYFFRRTLTLYTLLLGCHLIVKFRDGISKIR